MDTETGEEHRWARCVWVAGLRGLSVEGDLGVYTNVLRKLPMFLLLLYLNIQLFRGEVGTWAWGRLLFSSFLATTAGQRAHTTLLLALLTFILATKRLDTAVLERDLSRGVRAFLLHP